MTRWLLALVLATMTPSGFAQVAGGFVAGDFMPGGGKPAASDAERLSRAADCVSRLAEDANARRLCLDRIFFVPPANHEQGDLEKPVTPATVRSVITVSSDAKTSGTTYSVGDDPATFALTREDGKTGSTIQVGALYRLSLSTYPGFSPFAGIAIDRDTSTSEKSDVRQIITGATYDPWGSRVDGSSSVSRSIFTAQLRGRRDFVTSSTSSVALAQANWYEKNWQGSPGSPLHHLFLPFLGIARINATGATNAFGAARTFSYAGFTETFYPAGSAAMRLSLNVSGQITRDVSIDGTYRPETYKTFKAGVNYRLNSADDEAVVPLFTVYRQVGSDLIAGFTRRNRTYVGVGLKVNLP